MGHNDSLKGIHRRKETRYVDLKVPPWERLQDRCIIQLHGRFGIITGPVADPACRPEDQADASSHWDMCRPGYIGIRFGRIGYHGAAIRGPLHTSRLRRLRIPRGRVPWILQGVQRMNQIGFH